MRNAEERKAENKKLIEFLSEKCEELEEPLNVCKLIDEFKKKEEIKTQNSTLYTAIGIYKTTEIFKIKNKETMVRQLFCLGAKVDKDLLKKLKEDARVKLDGKGRIIKYESNDEELTLSGDHCATSKNRSEKIEERRRSRMIEQDGVDNEDMELEVQPPAPKKARVEDSGSAPEGTPAIQVRDQIPEEDVIVLDDVDEEENVQPNMENIEVKIEDPEVQEDIKQEVLEPSFGEGNQLDPMVKQEVPEPVMEDFHVKIENPEAMVTNSGSGSVSTSTTNTAPNLSAEQSAPPRMNIARTEEPKSGVAPNSAIPSGTRPSAPVVRSKNGPVASRASSSATQPPAPTAPGAARVLAAQNPPPTLPETPGPSSSTEPPAPTGVSTVTAPEQSAAPTDRQDQQPQTNVTPNKPMLPNATQLEILKSLEAIIGIMDLPMDSSQIQDQIQKMALNEIEMDDMKKTIDYSIVVAKMNRKSEGETRSLKDFLKLVQFTVVKDRFEQVQKELKEELEILKKNDKLVPVSNITMAVEVIVRILVSN